MGDSLGMRMKHNYEDRNRTYLTRRTPVIIRLDGKAFHTLTRGCAKPFDIGIFEAMRGAATEVFKNVQGAKVAYVQSDEVTILVRDDDTLDTDAWFDYNVQKMVSISASLMSVNFTKLYGKTGIFDSRVFNIPNAEVVNNFLWRCQDWKRNSIQMFSRSVFSHKELHKKSTEDMHEMLHQKGMNWTTDVLPHFKNGTFIYKNDMIGIDYRYDILPSYLDIKKFFIHCRAIDLT